MTKRQILVFDDNQECYPSVEQQDWIRDEYGCSLIFANPCNPIESGIDYIRKDHDKRIVAVLTDSLAGSVDPNRPPFWHIKELRKLRPELLIAVNTGRLTNEKEQCALEAGADECFRKGQPLDTFYEKVADRGRVLRSPGEEAIMPTTTSNVYMPELPSSSEPPLSAQDIKDYQPVTTTVESGATNEQLARYVIETQDARAFELIIERLYPIVRNILISRGFSEGELDDITQAVILRLWKNIGLYDFEIASFHQWIYALVQNEVLAFFRRRSRRERRFRRPRSYVPRDRMLRSVQSQKGSISFAIEGLADDERKILDALLNNTVEMEQLSHKLGFTDEELFRRYHTALARYRALSM